MTDYIHGPAISVEHDVQGELDPYKPGHLLAVDLAGTDLEAIPALWQASFTEYWSTQVGQVTVASCRRLLAEELTRRPDNESVRRGAWLCGAVPATEAPEEIRKVKADAEQRACRYADAAAFREKRDAAVAASIIAYGIGLESVREVRDENPSYMVPASVEWHYVLRSTGGKEYRFVDHYVWNFMRGVRREYGSPQGDTSLDLVESGEDERVFVVKKTGAGEERAYLEPEEAAAYHWVRLNGEGKKAFDTSG